MADPRIVIVGAGPAGTRAAEAFVRHGLRPVVIDEAQRSGGQIYRRQPPGFSRPAKAVYGFEAGRAEGVHGAFDALAGSIDHRPETLVWNIQAGAVHTAPAGGGAVGRVEYDALILATGACDRVIPFPGWTTAGVYTLGAAQIALKYQACAIGGRVVFMGTGPLLYLVAYQYAKAGAKVAAVLDTTTFATKLGALRRLLAVPQAFLKGLYYLGWLRRHGVAIHEGVTPVRAEGEQAVTAMVFRTARGQERRIECDAVGFGYGLQSETQLADLVGCSFVYEPHSRQWLPEADADGRSSVAGVYLAGDGRRVRGADFAEMAGELAALAVLHDVGRPAAGDRLAELRRGLDRGLRWGGALQAVFPVPHRFLGDLPAETVLCRCEGVTVGDARRAVDDLDAREINRAKALSRIGMGRCQGRYCGLSAATILAETAGADPSTAMRLRGQAPVKPIPLTQQEVPS
ncbi:NADPH-dependent 2,4-dienoyl-CoA reductase/sulfur reductase-like enzyme [Stella humosa]|uniref:NADPH-dependent 2,4-dienoyl-CoA reductase/sulfur reductase-like enzyme n=1 Tax=Stella humosa TaxID=94 RepID=A0A3N1MEY2_9PROT|nr:FAD/NAD(P)-binding oxidoreductase [Stella humosa]ROQ01257.1 NADPH-dependent 2,4-dienoyl-CoA reductase/sulfur reductase-like enzyme [Stella humosa]BBK31631.1 FAD/NAD(P)-binding oxidoreductase [Stella humosa]